MSTKCYVVGCKTGLASTRKKNKSEGRRNPSLFSVPKNPEERKIWQQVIPRHDRPLTEKDRVCSLHFRPEDIITVDIVDLPEYGIVWRCDRKKWVLKRGAFPRHFPDCPPPPRKSNKTCERKRPQNGQRSETEARPAEQGKLPNLANNTMKNGFAGENSFNFIAQSLAKNTGNASFLANSKQEKNTRSPLSTLIQNYNTQMLANSTETSSIFTYTSQEMNKRQDIITWIQNCNAQNFANDTKQAPVFAKADQKENVFDGQCLKTRLDNFCKSNLPKNTEPASVSANSIPTGNQRDGSNFKTPLQNSNPNLPTVTKAATKPVLVENLRSTFTFKKLLEKIEELELPVHWTYAFLINQDIKGIMLSKWINDELMDSEKRIIITPQLKTKIFVQARQIFLKDFTTVVNISSLNNLIYTIDNI